MKDMVASQSGAPTVLTTSSNQTPDAALFQALMAGMQPQQQQAVQAQLALLAKRRGNKKYVTTSREKHAPALTQGSVTQAYILGTPLSFTLPQPNNSYCRGIIVRVLLNYTNALNGGTFGKTAAGILGIIDTVEVRYNKSQIKIRPFDLRQLAMAGALDGNKLFPDNVSSALNKDTTLQNFVFTDLSTATGAQSAILQFFLPFNILRKDEDRGLLPTMPGETGVQVIVNTPTSLYGPDPVLNSLYQLTGAGGSIGSVSGTVMVESVYFDGENYSSPTNLAYDMSVLDGTIQMQQDTILTNLTAGNINSGKLNIMGKHAYVILKLIDGLQSNQLSTLGNLSYIASSQDDVGANVFWKYGSQTNLSVYDWFIMNRRSLQQDMDEGVLPFVTAPLIGESAPGLRDGQDYLDNTTSGWPAWHYNFILNSVGVQGTTGIQPRVEPFVVYINPVGLTPVG